MILLTKMEDMIQFIEWEQGADRILDIELAKDNQIIYTAYDKENDQKQSVTSFKDLRLSKEKANRVRKRDVSKLISRINGSIYPFVKWVKKGNRKVSFHIDEDLEIMVYDFDLEIGQTVRFLEDIDLYSEKILALMKACIPLDEENPKRKEMLKEIGKLEVKKAEHIKIV